MPNDENTLTRDAGGESAPCHYPPLAENLGSSVGVAFRDLCRYNEKCRSRTGPVFGVAKPIDARTTNRAAVWKIGKTRVNREPPVGNAGKVDVDARRIGSYLVKLLVRQHAVITAQAVAEGHVG